MLLHRIYNDQLAQASYLVGCAATGEALVVDPNRDIEQYVKRAEQEGLRITAVTETHIHADFVSGARELAARIGATLYLSDMGPDEWKYTFADEPNVTLLRDGDQFMIGNVRIEALHTSGHTPEHLSYLVTDTAAADEPMGVFTGDWVFVGDVGRPDLLERAAGHAGTMQVAARQLFRSLERFRALPDYLQIWPGHGAGSACGRSLGGVPQTTVGYEKRFNWAFSVDDEDTFVDQVLADQPPAPRYFAQMKRVNREGPRFTSGLTMPERWPADDLAARLDGDTTIVDMRPAEQFAARHVPGTLNLAFSSSLLTWAGWLLPYDRPLALIVDAAMLGDALQQLRLIGLDRIDGYWTPDVIDAWEAAGCATNSIMHVDVEKLKDRLDRGAVQVLDVRNDDEWARGHIAGSRHIPLHDLPQQLDQLTSDRPVAVHCQSGTRSAIAASLLTAHGFTDVLDLAGGFDAWQAAQEPVEQEANVEYIDA